MTRRDRIRLQPADRAWITLGVGVLLYDAAALPQQTLSERCDAWLISRPWLTRAVVAAVALHLVNGVPVALDPLHWLFTLSRRWRRSNT